MENENYKYDINTYAVRLINDSKFCNEQYSSFVSNCFCLDQVYGILSPDSLNSVLRTARKNKKIRIMLADMLFYVDKNSLSHDNFQMILNLPRSIRNTCLSNLGHTELAFYQMQELNRHPLALEAFSWLFDHICQFDFFTKEDMLQILRENPDVSTFAIQGCINVAYDKYGPSEKLEAASSWIASAKDTDRCF